MTCVPKVLREKRIRVAAFGERIQSVGNQIPILLMPTRNVAQFGRALLLGSRGRRFESCHSDWEFFPQINTSTTRMEIYTVAEWEEKFDELFERVENGETIGIVNEDGKAAVMVPANDELIKIYTELNNEAS